MKIVLSGVFTLLLVVYFLLYKAYRLLPASELRRRSRGGADKPAAAVYRMAAYGSAFELLVWLVGGASAAGLVILAAWVAWWAAGLAVMAIAWLVLFINPIHDTGSRAWRLAAWLAPLASFTLAGTEALIGKAGFHFTRSTHYRPRHTGAYDRDDLLELLKHQAGQPDNRVSPADLAAAAGGLTFSEKSVGKVMVPAHKIKTVGVNQSVGPLLMDELHKSGLKRFPVVRDVNAAKPEIVGTLAMDDVLEHAEKGRVRELMDKEVCYVNESQSLREALDTILKNQRLLLVVSNDAGEVAGIITLEDVLTQLFNQKLVEEFSSHEEEQPADSPVRQPQSRHKMVK